MSFINIEKIKSLELVTGFPARFVHTDNLTMAFFSPKAGAVLPLHSHEHEQISNVLSGEFELTIDGVTRLLKPGVVARIPSHARHSGRAITDCELLDIFHPVREDYRLAQENEE